MFHVVVQSIMKTLKKPYFVTLVNPLNSEEWICEDYNDTRFIDGVEYVKVRKPIMQRTVLMRKDALRKK
jgi:hypothetical protein